MSRLDHRLESEAAQQLFKGVPYTNKSQTRQLIIYIQECGAHQLISMEDLARKTYGRLSKTSLIRIRQRVGSIVRAALLQGIILTIEVGPDGYLNGEPIGHHKIRGIKLYDPNTATEADRQRFADNLQRLARRRELSAEQVRQMEILAGVSIVYATNCLET